MSQAGNQEKLTCQQAEEWLVDYLYGELEPERHEAFRRHLQECSVHRAEVKSLQSVISLIRQQPVEMPEDLSLKIRSVARQKLQERSAERSWWRWLGASPLPVAVAAAVAVVLLTMALWRVAQVPQQAEETASQPVKVAEKPVPAAAPSPAEEKYFAADRLAEAEPPEMGGGSGAGPMAEGEMPRRPRGKKSAELAAPRKATVAAKPVTTAEAAAAPEPVEKPAPPPEAAVAAAASRPRRVAARPVPEAPAPAEAKPASEVGGVEGEGRSARDDLDSRPAVAMDNERSQSAADTEFERARAFMKAGDCEKQIQAAGRAVAATPRHRLAAPTLLDQASCLVKLQRFGEAREIYRRVEREFPAHAEDARAGLRRLGGK